MRTLLKKSVYLFLTLAITNLSIQAIYASSAHNCEHANVAVQNIDDADHHHTHQADQVTSCDNCDCHTDISIQASILSTEQIFLGSRTPSNISDNITHQYQENFYNPLLRPPIYLRFKISG